MSTTNEIREAYIEDKADPFDVVTGGKRRGKFSRSREERQSRPRTASQTLWIFGQTDPNWKWGHFADALRKALPEKKAKFDPYRAYRRLERMLPGVQLTGQGL